MSCLLLFYFVYLNSYFLNEILNVKEAKVMKLYKGHNNEGSIKSYKN